MPDLSRALNIKAPSISLPMLYGRNILQTYSYTILYSFIKYLIRPWAVPPYPILTESCFLQNNSFLVGFLILIILWLIVYSSLYSLVFPNHPTSNPVDSLMYKYQLLGQRHGIFNWSLEKGLHFIPYFFGPVEGRWDVFETTVNLSPLNFNIGFAATI